MPFWNVQVMLYNMSYKKSNKRDFFPKYSAIGREVFQCSLWLCICDFFLLIDFLVAYVVEHHLHIPEWYHTPTSDF
jgi:hypothetical protein